MDDLIGWDIRNWSRALGYWLAHSKQDISRCTALEIGAGRGGLSLWMAQQGAAVVCSDLGGAPERAVRSHRDRGMSDRISYANVNATEIPYADQFDVVLFKSVVGAVGYHGGKAGQIKVFQEIWKALKPGGELFFAENLVGSPLHMMLRRYYRRWGDRWRYVSLPEIKEMLAPFSSFHIKALGVAGALGTNARQQSVLGAIDGWLLNWVLPDEWKYVVIGYARK